ncbi:hypothetical protein [Sediminibacterium sp.]|uniref:hypothetical protein n=1 Tax=Sediminibacterium sp. TaxID=1917865 RepID=UPI00273749FC|nr:hypothetical protein [Sediminibacterium sp.]MDP3394922.1 hypothetical protein [Sediminibacterium sp.]MDP3565548.1 hypothetical protein [Sediminibacterium sp.]
MDKKIPEQLPDFVLANLFPSNLVIVESAEKTLPTVAPKPVAIDPPAYSGPAKERPEKWYLGNNGKNIVILVQEPEAAFLNEESLDFLTKILGACKLNMGDVAVINIARYLANFTEIKQELNPTSCLLFNVNAAMVKLPFTVPNYQVQQYGGCKFLMAPSLLQYYGDSGDAKLEKTKLWVSLKSLFNL